ncbi:MAG TPA: UTP--glucose-1-phosphate uridylyltransferase [Candidatus Cloacimonadota bacterium]|nr:UTP--glucose-1-phosphate uridylyltransferase [Candidatus Cloacimonadota bacterium]
MLSQFVKLMKTEGIEEDVINTFSEYYKLLAKGEKGLLSNQQIEPPKPENVINYETIRDHARTDALKSIVVIKLNGGLGTSMGLSKAKSLLPVKGNMNFLDIIARQILTLRSLSGYDLSLLFMNSFNTDTDTLDYLQKYPDIGLKDLPLSFVQNKFPRIRRSDLKFFESGDRTKSWNPPGHGDLYTAITKDHLLDKLIDKGFRYAFVSNADNLGATVDTAIPNYMEKNNIHFLMEVCDRTETDKKGGHLCQDERGQLMLREIAQCPENELDEFQDINKFRYFNTNNLWIDLKALQWSLIAGDGIMLLPLIVNPKTIDGVQVIQLETAMGAAISVFNNSKALLVPRSRFAPVKKTVDLLSVWSDAYELNDQYQIVLKRGLSTPPKVELDEKYYGSITQMMSKFAGVPSLSGCKELKIEGDVSFGDEVICEGRVHIKASVPVQIKNRFLTGEINY